MFYTCWKKCFIHAGKLKHNQATRFKMIIIKKKLELHTPNHLMSAELKPNPKLNISKKKKKTKHFKEQNKLVLT